MKAKVLGIQKNVNFKSQDGNQITGMNLYFGTVNQYVDGYATEKAFISTSKACFAIGQSLKVGDDVECYYNRFGKIDDIVPVKG